MKIITSYQARDGRCFPEQKTCIAYEQLLEKIDDIMQPLVGRPDDCNFTNGHGYIQQERTIIEQANARFLVEASLYLNRDAEELGYLLGRFLDDMGSPLYGAWIRFQCIDNQHREWGQIYYANNPNEGTQSEYKETEK